MSILKIREDSKNYTAQIIKLPAIQEIKGLDNLVSVNIQGNNCLIGKDSDPEELYIFFPCEAQLSHDFLSSNNLYRHKELNKDKSQGGFIENNRRVKAIKFKGIISTGLVLPLSSLSTELHMAPGIGTFFAVGDEFNSIGDFEVCRKYIKKFPKEAGMSNPRTSKIEGIIDHKFAPQHMDTSHLMKNLHKLTLDTYISVTYKLHGTSFRIFNAPVKRNLSLLERISKYFGAKILTEEYNYVVGSRKCIKSVGFEELPGKNHYYTEGDVYSSIGKELFQDKLNCGEAIYAEIIGKTPFGVPVMPGYSYGLNKLQLYIYRISNINSQGIEVDLPYHQMIERGKQLGVNVVPELFYGTLQNFLFQNGWNWMIKDSVAVIEKLDLEKELNDIFYNKLLEQPSILDKTIIEEGFCLRIDQYPRPEILKIKSKKFLLHEGKQLDKQDSIDIEEIQEA